MACTSPPTHPSAKREEAIFEIVNQLNRGSHLISSTEEREQVAELNLIAGRRAKSSTAYASALKYLRAGSALLTEETWKSNYELVFAIECVMAECELLTADMVAAENRLLMLVRTCELPPRYLRGDAFAAHPLHHFGSERPRGRRVPGLAPSRWNRVVEAIRPVTT